MKFPESWLREHVEVAADSATLCKTLTAIGLEVESSEAVGGELAGVVVGEIVACEKHPEADRLQLCRVNVGAAEPVQIVCGAPNARLGLKAPLAQVGAELPGGLQIKPAKLRGVASFGMLCSAKELGIDADASGLLELPADAPVGRPLADYLGLPDCSIEIKLTPNRADCFSVQGIAYDVAAALSGQVRLAPGRELPATSQAVLAVDVSASEGCPRYLGRIIEGVDGNVATPLWMSERLRRSGIRPLSFLVDVTQYVMLELGQPMHAFDADCLQGPVGVRLARAGETLQLLDQREVTLDSRFLIITDADRPVALAGVMGGYASRVTAASRRVFLESAHFAPEAIIGRARALGLHTDASHRFERGVDPELPRRAIERASQLIIDIAGGHPGPVVAAECSAQLPRRPAVGLRAARLRRVLGLEVAAAEVERILTALGMDVQPADGGWTVTPPSRRFDIAIEEDLIEEIARIHGYEALPMTAPSGEVPPARLPEARIPHGAVRQQLAARDYFEAINFAFLDRAVLALWGLEAAAVALANPLSAELGVMRPALLPGLLEAARRNRARQQPRVRLFELGRVFASAAEAPQETLRVAAVATGSALAEQWAAAASEVDFYDVKGDLESLLALAGGLDAVEYRPCDVGWLHPGRSAEVWRQGRRLGVIGHLHPRLAAQLDLDEVVVFELDVEPLCERQVPRAQELSRYPSVRRDLAVLVPEPVSWATLQRCLRERLGSRLRELQIFDQYRGPGLEVGFKSLAMGLILQDTTRTLTDQDIEGLVAGAVQALADECGARLRA